MQRLLTSIALTVALAITRQTLPEAISGPRLFSPPTQGNVYVASPEEQKSQS